MGGILLVHLPKEENDEGDKKGAGTNEHNVHRSLLSEERLSSKLRALLALKDYL